MSERIDKQERTYGPKVYVERGDTLRIFAHVRHDDRCKNGRNNFAITGTIEEKRGSLWIDCAGGMLHEDIAKHFPELAPFLKWHLCATDGPLHYIANTLYWAQQGNLEYARKSAIWPDANIEDFTKENLEARLPALLEEFRKAVESLGLTY